MTAVDMKELAQAVLNNLGQLRKADAPEETLQLPVRKAMRQGVARSESGCTRKWRHETATYEIMLKDLGERISPEKFVDLIVRKRREAMGKLLEQLDRVFKEVGGGEGWGIVVLQGEWMTETILAVAGGLTVYVDCTFAFELLPVDELEAKVKL